MTSSSLSNEFYSMSPQTLGDVRQELEKRAPMPGTRILNDFIESGQTIMRFSTTTPDLLNYFYNAVSSSIQGEQLQQRVWIRKTMFSPTGGFSFLLFNLDLADQELIRYYRTWKDSPS